MINNQNNDFLILLNGLSESLSNKNAFTTRNILQQINTQYSDWKSFSQIAELYNEHIPNFLDANPQNTHIRELLFEDILDINRIQEVELRTNVYESCIRYFQTVSVNIKIKILELFAFYDAAVDNICVNDFAEIFNWYNEGKDDDTVLFNSQIQIYQLLLPIPDFKTHLVENIVHCAQQEIKPKCTLEMINRFNLLEPLHLYIPQLKTHHNLSTHYILFMLSDSTNVYNRLISPIYLDNGTFNNRFDAKMIKLSTEIFVSFGLTTLFSTLQSFTIYVYKHIIFIHNRNYDKSNIEDKIPYGLLVTNIYNFENST